MSKCEKCGHDTPVPEALLPITDNDKRWRLLEHGCQWVSWTPTGGETHSFDPRDVKELQRMRAWADETIKAQLAILEKGRRELEATLSPQREPKA